ncbi:MAG: S-layer homology domain-containing protein [Acidimicrobiia bacterium]|nr:S-layer homology domain-containing protein [Acidimicrobiia bacterium]
MVLAINPTTPDLGKPRGRRWRVHQVLVGGDIPGSATSGVWVEAHSKASLAHPRRSPLTARTPVPAFGRTLIDDAPRRGARALGATSVAPRAASRASSPSTPSSAVARPTGVLRVGPLPRLPRRPARLRRRLRAPGRHLHLPDTRRGRVPGLGLVPWRGPARSSASTLGLPGTTAAVDFAFGRFQDVPHDYLFWPAISWVLREEAIVPDGDDFEPTRTVDRIEAIVALWRLAASRALTPPPRSRTSTIQRRRARRRALGVGDRHHRGLPRRDVPTR